MAEKVCFGEVSESIQSAWLRALGSPPSLKVKSLEVNSGRGIIIHHFSRQHTDHLISLQTTELGENTEDKFLVANTLNFHLKIYYRPH